MESVKTFLVLALSLVGYLICLYCIIFVALAITFGPFYLLIQAFSGRL